jgi:hypothetical protein
MAAIDCTCLIQEDANAARQFKDGDCQEDYMKHAQRICQVVWTLLTLWPLHMPAFGQFNPHTALHDALVQLNRGSFETAAKVAKAAIDSGQLSGNELGGGTSSSELLAKGLGI